MLDEIKIIISILLGAASAAIPLYFKMRSMGLKLKEQAQKLDLDNKTKEHKLELTNRINHEAEWKRIIEFRDQEMKSLRERDNQQEERINDLFAKYLESQKLEARCAERTIAQNDQIKFLLEKISKLEEILIQRGAGT